MFEVNGKYANRKGEYTVLAINPPKMNVRYEDGTEVELNMNIQGRIWENIVSEREAESAIRLKRAQQNKHYIKVVSVPSPDELSFPGWHERVIMVNEPAVIDSLKPGDRVIYYAMESKTFIAVATVTGQAFTANPKDYLFTIDTKTATFFPMDRDADAHRLDNGLSAEAVDLESQPNFRKLDLISESMLTITEDDFELLAETLTEVSEESDDEDLDDDDFEEEEDE